MRKRFTKKQFRDNYGIVKKKNTTIYGHEVVSMKGMYGYCRNSQHEGWVYEGIVKERNCLNCPWFIRK